MPHLVFRLRKHADYQRVYKASRKNFAKQMSYFFTLRTASEIETDPDGATGPRIGLTVGKVMGKAVDRNRIKRRMTQLDREVATVFRTIQKLAARTPPSQTPASP
jgi:ribonuclease P protein component